MTTPVAVPLLPVTEPVRLPETVPAVPVTLAGLSVTVAVALPVALTAFQALIKLATFGVPSPVARSKPTPAVKAGPFDASTPKPPLEVLLQFGEPPVQGTELFSVGVFPLAAVFPVMSLKTQEELLLPLLPWAESQLA